MTPTHSASALPAAADGPAALLAFIETQASPVLAAIDWADTITALNRGQLPCSGGEARVLRLAASLAHGIPVDLADALPGLDPRNADLVAHAVKHATGHR